LLELIILALGICIGSFLNVCIYRVPVKISIIMPPSHCFQCKKQLKSWDLIPIISYFFLQGRCRYCRSLVSARYPFVELLTGLSFLWCFVIVGLSYELIKTLILTSFLIVISFIDYDHQLILDKVLIWLAGVGVAINLYTGYVSVLQMLLAALVGGGILLAIALASRGGMGMGDVKFAAVLGLWLGVQHIVLTLFLSFIIGGIGGVILLALKLKSRKDAVPFGPYLAVGAFIAMLYGNNLLRWYIVNFL